MRRLREISDRESDGARFAVYALRWLRQAEKELSADCYGHQMGGKNPAARPV